MNLARLFCAVLLTAGLLAAQVYSDVTPTSGLSLPAGPQVSPGQGGCCGDFDSDGDEDLILVAGPGQALKHYRNDGGLVFTDVTATQPLTIGALVKGVVAADIDNDGDPDVAVAQYGAPFLLFINDGTGNFTEEATLRGVGFTGAAWSPLFSDFNRDGWLDLFVGFNLDPVTGASQSNRIFVNTGGGWFSEVTGTTGLEDVPGLFLAGTWFDHNEDGWPDLVIANDKGHNPNLFPGSIYRNNTDGTFSDICGSSQCYLPVDGMGADVVDLFNDGGWEVYITDNPPDHVMLSLNPQSGTYTDLAVTLGVSGGTTLMGWGCHFLDADNDGWQDIHVTHHGGTNTLYKNPGAAGGAWTDVAPTAGCAQSEGQYSTIIADFDDDGGLDILNLLPWMTGISVLRQTAPVGNWLKIETEGTLSNRDGLGARIELTSGGRKQRQFVRTGRGYLTGSDRRTHFGLGSATQADSVVIHWPSGAVQYLQNVPANQILLVREPAVTSTALPAAGAVTAIDLEFPGESGLGYLLGLSLGSAPGALLPDGRRIPLNLDDVLLYVLQPNPILWPTTGTLAAPSGTASVPLFLPGGSQGISLTLAALSLSPGAPYGAASLSAPYTFQIQ